MMIPSDFSHILYHGNCADGFGAAWAAWQVLGERAVYLPVRHGDPLPELPSQARVAILDFSFPRACLLELQQRCSQLFVLDHHRSAEVDLQGLEWARFDMSKSGARLAWEYWHPEQPLPDLLAYVEDRDLWLWRLPESREVSLALQTYPMEFADWQQLEIEQLRLEGRALLRWQNQLVTRAASRARWLELAGHRVPVVNSPLFQSEICEELGRLHPEAPFTGCYYLNHRELEAWSLRSQSDFDVSQVAAQFGGGGHPQASGFARSPR